MAEFYINSLIDIANYIEALRFSVKLFLKNKNYLVKIPFHRLLDIIDSNVFEKSLIEIPIIQFIHFELINIDIRRVSYAFEDFLLAQNISLPSELENEMFINKYEKSMLVFFLENICIQSVLEDYVEIQSYEENRNERKRICEFLIRLNPENSKCYINEIFTLTQEQLINDGMKRIDESRINVDVESIKLSLNKKLLPLFERYTSLSYSNIVDNEYFTLYIDEEGIPFQITENSKKNIFHSMVTQVVTMFGFDSRYGLDVSLSTKIRHGFLVGNIREIFVKKNLVTKKDSNDTYVDNKYWRDKYDTYLGADIVKILKLLNNFSKDIDHHLMHLKNNLLRIKTDGINKEGLFDFTFEKQELEEMESAIIDETSLSVFLDIIIEKLWEKTEHDLIIIREKITHEILLEFHELIGSLIANILKVESEFYADFHEIRNVLNETKILLQNEFLLISNWFKKPQDSIMPDYKISYVCEIALEFLKKTFARVDYIEINVDDIKLSGSTFKSIFFIVYNILHNALKYGNINEKSTLQIYIKDNELVFEVFNKSTEDISVSREKISTILNNIEKGNCEKVTKEDGTGFYKINNIIRNEIKLLPKIIISIDDEYNYNSKISFEIGAFLK